MAIFSQILLLTKKIAASLLKGEEPKALNDSDLFDQKDKAYIYKHLTDDKLIKERLHLSNKIDKHKDWQTVRREINVPVKKLVVWRYAAAAVLIGVLATAYVFRANFFNSNIEESPMPIVKDVNTIEPGTDKATLTLEDGSQIALEKGNKIQTQNAISNGEKLIYKNNDKKLVELVFNLLTVPRGGQFYLELSDGTKVWLNSDSRLKYPINFIKGKAREVELVYGEAYFDVSPSSEHDGAKFKVKSGIQEIEVLGTEFNLKAYQDETNMYTTLVEGKVVVSNGNAGKQNLLPNQQLNFDLSYKTFEVKTVDVYNEISWKEGIFSFEDKSLEKIMKVISRWYDVDVLFINQDIKSEVFVGVLGKEQKIEEILTSIKAFGIMDDYEIDGKTILLK